jgi:hypothetical protein
VEAICRATTVAEDQGDDGHDGGGDRGEQISRVLGGAVEGERFERRAGPDVDLRDQRPAIKAATPAVNGSTHSAALTYSRRASRRIIAHLFVGRSRTSTGSAWHAEALREPCGGAGPQVGGVGPVLRLN